MPQKDTKYWIKCINEGSTYEEVVNRIGNLTLVDSKDNSSMKNTDFKNKKDILNKSSHIKMNVNILNKELWSEEGIDKRSAKLANEFIKIFPYPEFEITEDEDVYSHIN